MALFEGALLGQELKVIGYTTSTERSVLSVLLRERCDPKWISHALRDSGIEASERNNLPPGRKILLYTRSCHLPAPLEVARASAPLLPAVSGRETRTRIAQAGRVARQTQAPQSAIPVPTNDFLELQKQKNTNDQLRAENKLLADRVGVLTGERETIRKEKDVALANLSQRIVKGRLVNLLLIFVSILLGSLIGAGAHSYWHKRLLANLVTYERTKTLKVDGEIFRYSLIAARGFKPLATDPTPHYKCEGEFCSNSDIIGDNDHLIAHAKECPSGRLHTHIDRPSEEV